MSDLDTRLRSAGTSLHHAVAPLTPGTPPVDAGRPDRRALLAAAAGVLLVVALAAVALARRGDDQDSDVTTDTDRVPRLVLDEAVVGLPATGATDLPLAGEMAVRDATVHVGLYEAAAPARPGGTVEVAALTFRSLGDPDALELDDGEAVTVQGTTGRVTDEPTFGLTVAWKPAPEQLFMLATRDTGAREELVAMADAGTVSPDGFTPGPTGAGVDPPNRQAQVDDVDLWTGVPMSASAVGHMVGYQSDDGTRMVMLTTFAGSDAEAEVVRWMTGAQEPLEVRGHDGWAGEQEYASGSDGGSGSAGSASSDSSIQEETTSTISTIRTLVWEEAPGVHVVLRGSDEGDGIGEAEMLRLADSLRPAGDAEWEALGHQVDSAAEPDASAVIEGDFEGGTWAVYVDAEGSLCGGTQTESSGSSVCGSAPGGAGVLTDDDGAPLVVYGALPPGAADVQVPGGASGMSTGQTADGATTLYAITVDGGPLPTEVVFVDEAGQEVARADVGSDTLGTIPGTVP